MAGQGRTPRYAEILNVLRAEIAEGTPPVGALLPTEAALCARFGVSRFTVREALRRLAADGVVERAQGAGSRVLRHAPAPVFVQSYQSVSDLTQYAAETRFDVLEVRDTILSEELADRIGAAAGERWQMLRGVRRTADGEALAFVESFVPGRFADIAPDLARGAGPIYAGLARAANEAVEEADQETQALSAPAEVAEALGLEKGAPVLRFLRRYRSASGVLIASFNWHHGGDRYVHRTRLGLDGR